MFHFTAMHFYFLFQEKKFAIKRRTVFEILSTEALFKYLPSHILPFRNNNINCPIKTQYRDVLILVYGLCSLNNYSTF